MEEVGSSEVSLSEKVVLVLLAVEAGAIEEGSGFLSSRRILGCAIMVCTIKPCAVKLCTIKPKAVCHQGGCHEGRFRILLSRRVSSRWILSCVFKTGVGSRSRSEVHQPRFGSKFCS